MGIYGNRSARRRAVFLKFALANEAPPSASDIGIRFAVIGHVDKRDRAAHLVFDFHDEPHKHVGIEGVEKVQVRVGGKWSFECASAEHVDVGETPRPVARVFGDIGQPILGFTTTFCPGFTNCFIPPSSLMARRNISSGSPPITATRSGLLPFALLIV